MAIFLARLSSPARYILLLSTCLLLVFGSFRSVQAGTSEDRRNTCVTAYRWLNIRSGPSTNYPIIAYAPWGSQVSVIDWDGRGGWKKVVIHRYFDILYDGWAKTSWLEPVPDGLTGKWCPNWLTYTDKTPYGSYPATPPPAPTAVPRWKPAPTAVPTRAPVVSCNIKGNISYTTGEKIYHVPGQQHYRSTIINTYYGERWFCSEAEARAAGWRKSYR